MYHHFRNTQIGFSESWAEDPPIIIALTADVMEENKTKCLEIGIKDFIMKPIVVNIFKDILSKYLERKL